MHYFSTAFLPPIDYFVCLLNSDNILIEKYENYIKQTFRNRCYIYGPNGIQALSIPVNKINGNKTLIKDIRISYHTDWQLMQWKSFETAYNSSPFFMYYMDELIPFFTEKFDYLLEYNSLLLTKLLEIIAVDKEIRFTESYVKSEDLLSTNDFRNVLTPQFSILHPRYIQVYNNKFGFIPNLSIIDLIFNLGPDTLDYLNSCKGRL